MLFVKLLSAFRQIIRGVETRFGNNHVFPFRKRHLLPGNFPNDYGLLLRQARSQSIIIHQNRTKVDLFGNDIAALIMGMK